MHVTLRLRALCSDMQGDHHYSQVFDARPEEGHRKTRVETSMFNGVFRASRMSGVVVSGAVMSRDMARFVAAPPGPGARPTSVRGHPRGVQRVRLVRRFQGRARGGGRGRARDVTGQSAIGHFDLESAFAADSGLARVRPHAFQGARLFTVQLPPGVAVGQMAFANCRWLGQVSPTVTQAGCAMPRHVALPAGLEAVGARWFAGSRVESVRVPARGRSAAVGL